MIKCRECGNQLTEQDVDVMEDGKYKNSFSLVLGCQECGSSFEHLVEESQFVKIVHEPTNNSANTEG